NGTGLPTEYGLLFVGADVVVGLLKQRAQFVCQQHHKRLHVCLVHQPVGEHPAHTHTHTHTHTDTHTHTHTHSTLCVTPPTHAPPCVSPPPGSESPPHTHTHTHTHTQTHTHTHTQ